jgi:TonB family protein
VALAMTGGVAAFQAQTFTTLSGSIVDSTNRPLAGAAVVLTTGPNREKREIKSDATGHFELDGLPPAEYRLEVWAAGFGPFAETVSLGARPVQRVVRLEVGSLTETVTVYEGAPPVSQPATEPREYTLPPCVSGAVGGHINQPLKLADKRPIYPTAAHSAGQVHVRLEGRIGTDGYFQELKVASPTQPEFDAAAVEAVRQWRFSQTRLNCVPIDVPMTVHVSFVPKP